MGKVNLSGILGWEPGAEMVRKLLAEVKTSGLTIQEVAAKYQMPEMMILGSDGRGNVDGKRMTPQEFHTENPYRRLVVIRRRRQTGGVTNTE